MAIIELIELAELATIGVASVAGKAVDKVLEVGEKATSAIGSGVLNISEKQDIKLKKHMSKLKEDYPRGEVFYLDIKGRMTESDIRGKRHYYQYHLYDIDNNEVYLTNEFETNSSKMINVFRAKSGLVGTIKVKPKLGKRVYILSLNDGRTIQYESRGLSLKDFINKEYEYYGNATGSECRGLYNNHVFLKKEKDCCPVLLCSDKSRLNEAALLLISLSSIYI